MSGAPSAMFPERRRSVDTGFVFTTRLIGMGLTFLAGVVAARAFTPEIRGEYALFMTLAALVSALANLGFAEAVVYFFRRGDADHERTSTTILLMNAAVASLVLALGLLLGPWIASRYFPTGGLHVAWLALGAGVVSIFFRNGVVFLQARGDFLGSSLLSLVQPILFMVGLVAIWLRGGAFPLAAQVFLASWGLSALPVLLPLFRHLRPRVLRAAYVGNLLRFSLKSFANVAMGQLNYRVDIFILAYLLPDLAGVADYHIASALVGLLWIVPDAYGTVIYPRLAGLGVERERSAETIQAIRIVLLPVLLMTFALAIAVPFAIPLIFGDRYDGAVLLTLLLLPGVLAMSVNKLLSRYFLSRNRHQVTVWATTAGVLIDVIALFAFVPLYGVAGASVAASVAYVATVGLTGAAFLRVSDLRRDDLRGFPRREIAVYRRLARDGFIWTRTRSRGSHGGGR